MAVALALGAIVHALGPARVAAHEPDLCFVFFDGEEAMREYGREDGLWGSKFFELSIVVRVHRRCGNHFQRTFKSRCAGRQ